MDVDQVQVHDPKGYPSAALPVEYLLKAWRADGMDLAYTDEPFTMRIAFRPQEPSSRQQMIERTLPFIRENLQQELWQQGMFGGVTVLHMLTQTFQTGVSERLATHLFYWAPPLGLRHKVDAQTFLREGKRFEAADLIAQQARLLGRAQFAGVQHFWPEVATLFEQVATLEERLLAALRS